MLTVTLPTLWVKNNKLKTGNQVEVKDRGNYLVISKIKQEDENTLKITLESNNEWYIGQIIRFCYFSEYKKTRLYFKTKKDIKIIEKETNKLRGYEVVDVKKDFCVLQNISEVMEDQYARLFRKVFLISIQMFDLLSNKQVFLEEIKTANRQAHKDALFCRKVITNDLDSNEKTYDYILLQRLTMITNNLNYIAKHLKLKKIKLSKEEMKQLNFCKKIYQEFYETYYKPSSKAVIKLSEQRMNFVMSMRKQKSISTITHYLWEIVRLIGSSGSIILKTKKKL